jgi:hypothetical protein
MIGRVRDTQPKQTETDDRPDYWFVSEIMNPARFRHLAATATAIPAAYIPYHPV